MVKMYYCQMIMGGFGSPNKEWIQKQIAERNKEVDILSRAIFIEKDIPNENLGLCWNNFPHNHNRYLVCKDDSQCSVGLVRVMRMDLKEDAGTCLYCPYFVSMNTLNEITTNQMNLNCNCESCVEKRKKSEDNG